MNGFSKHRTVKVEPTVDPLEGTRGMVDDDGPDLNRDTRGYRDK